MFASDSQMFFIFQPISLITMNTFNSPSNYLVCVCVCERERERDLCTECHGVVLSTPLCAEVPGPHLRSEISYSDSTLKCTMTISFHFPFIIYNLV